MQGPIAKAHFSSNVSTHEELDGNTITTRWEQKKSSEKAQHVPMMAHIFTFQGWRRVTCGLETYLGFWCSHHLLNILSLYVQWVS